MLIKNLPVIRTAPIRTKLRSSTKPKIKKYPISSLDYSDLIAVLICHTSPGEWFGKCQSSKDEAEERGGVKEVGGLLSLIMHL